MRLDGRRVLVVGVGPGLGSSTVYLLLKDGAKVIMAARTKERLEKLRSELGKYGRVDYVFGDASTLYGSKSIIEGAVRCLGGIDDLILLAGNYVDTPIARLGEENMDAMVSVLLL